MGYRLPGTTIWAGRQDVIEGLRVREEGSEVESM